MARTPTAAKKGLNAQTNLVITAFVEEDGGSVLHTQAVNIPLLDVGETDVSVLFPDVFVPNLDPGLYRVGYTLSSDSIDQRPLDNERVSQFVVSNNVFAKENGPEQGYRPSAGGDWAVANYHRMSGGNFEQYKATVAEFAFSTNADELAIGDVESTIYLLQINDDVAEDFSNFDGSGFGSSSLEFVGIASYEAPDSLGNYQLQQVLLTDFNTSEDGVLLQTGGRYLLVVEYSGPNDRVFHAFNDDVYYYFPSTFIYNNDWNVNGFGGDVNALLHSWVCHKAIETIS